MLIIFGRLNVAWMFSWDSPQNIIYPEHYFLHKNVYCYTRFMCQCLRVLTCLQALVCALADISSGDSPISNQRPTLKSIPGMHSVSRSPLWLYNTVQIAQFECWKSVRHQCPFLHYIPSRHYYININLLKEQTKTDITWV